MLVGRYEAPPCVRVVCSRAYVTCDGVVSGSLPVVTTSTNEVVVPFWQVSVSGIRVERLPRDDWLVPGHAVLNITVRNTIHRRM